MGTARERVEHLTSDHTKSELKEILGRELGESYESPVPDSLKNDFLRVCFQNITENETVDTRLRRHDDYSPDWAQKGTKHNLATAVRMVLTERTGRGKHDSITSLSKTVVAELIVACRLAESAIEMESSVPEAPTEPPTRPSVTPSPYRDSLKLNDPTDAAIREWVSDHQTDADGSHAVYVLDCTPPVDGTESSRLESLRATVADEDEAPSTLTELEQAGVAANRGERVYYVGYTSDVLTRIHQHLLGAAAASARFTNLFEPRALVEVTWFDTEASAKAFEKQRADELTVEGESYAYFN